MRKLATKSIAIIILCIIATSCVTQRACLQKFPPQVGVTDTVVYRDTVYFFRTDRDTVWAVASWMDTVSVDEGLIIGQAWVARDSIYIKVVQRDTLIQWRDSVRTEIREVTKVVTAPPEFNAKLWQYIILAAIMVVGVFLIMRRR